MRIAQLVGPLNKNQTYVCPVPAGKYNYIHIGIETPQVSPMSEVTLDDMVSFILSLDSEKFRINANDILEFADINMTNNINIMPLQDMDAYTIIQIAYTAVES